MLYLAYIVSMTYLLTHLHPQTEAETGLTSLRTFLGEHRLLIVFPSREEMVDILAQLKSIDEELALIDRDILWFVVSGNIIHSNYAGDLNENLPQTLKNLYQIDPSDETELLLLGKDGEVK